jgi:hypothetical protein
LPSLHLLYQRNSRFHLLTKILRNSTPQLIHTPHCCDQAGRQPKEIGHRLAASSGPEQFQTKGFFNHPAGSGVKQFGKNHLHNPPYLDSAPGTAGDRLLLAAAGHVEVEQWVSFLVRKEGAGTGRLMDMLKGVGHRLEKQAAILPRPDDQPTAVIGTPDQ